MISWLATLLLAAAPASASDCAMQPADRAWIGGAIANWRTSEQRLLKLAPSPLPLIVAVDAKCSFLGQADRRGRIVWKGTQHAGTITLPDGSKASVGVMSFTAPTTGAATGGFFVMSLPSVWRTGGVTSELGLETLMSGVLLHEMAHTRQFYFANPELERLTNRYGLPADINDDSLQDAFKDDPAYVKGYEAERDLLYASAAAPDIAEARRLAGRALQAMRDRRARWFTASAEKWAPLDETFLTMEGLGQWLFYKWLVAGKRPAVAPAAALEGVRRKRGQWSQDEGLGLFLVIDRLVPDWQKRVFAAKPATAEDLLALAAGETRTIGVTR